MKKITLCVAEKPSVAKAIAQFLSGSNYNSVLKILHSKFNPVYCFDHAFQNQPSQFKVTSVLGHVKCFSFPDSCKNWNTTHFKTLYHVPLEKKIIESSLKVVRNLESLSKESKVLILWLDCDREGEAIAFDVYKSCHLKNPRLEVYRAHFSALTKQDITHAMASLTQIDQNLADAVFVRQEIDLRIGASFTRYQTLMVRRLIPNYLENQSVVSYGPCQFPTLGFIVKRFQKIRDFKPKDFYTFDCKCTKNGNFQWKRERIYDPYVTYVIFEEMLEAKYGRVSKVTNQKKMKKRPTPLNTIEFQKMASRKLKISSDDAMSIAEKLYQQGYISYPRTETNKYSPTINTKDVVKNLEKGSYWEYIHDLLHGGLYAGPSNGNSDDKAHPPIHPVKEVKLEECKMSANEKRVYDLITRHFLASLSKDAVGFESKIEMELGGEEFSMRGLRVVESNWLRIFPFDKWVEHEIPSYEQYEKVIIEELFVREKKTQPPSYLSEADLISLMDTNGIGTDATIHEHIKTVQARGYAIKQNGVFKPTELGVALVEAYEHIGVLLNKPTLRANMELDMKHIAQGIKKKPDVLHSCLEEMEKIFEQVSMKKEKMEKFLESALKK